ncbi:MAG: GDP-mannose 4,6-dehydratase [Sedimentisphaerales bacterium]|nr:GDP-mannose 4,6-dehydratase [Sedimentisphaerales bacterium]
MKALVTGGAGFIGSHLAERLLRDGNNVVVVDNLSTGRMSNIERLMPDSRFRFVGGDIRDLNLMKFAAERCDTVFHLAAAVGVQLIADDPVHTIETNIGGTETVLEAANKVGAKVLIASSSEVYGKSEAVPFSEDDDLVMGSTRMSRWAYACSKAVDEFLGLAFHQQYGLPVVIGRFFNTIGPRQTGQYGMVVPRFVSSALKGEPVRIYGTGKQTRCFCYVEDLVEALIGLVGCDETTGEVFNIGSAEEVSIEALADTIIEMTGSSSKKEFISYEDGYGRAIEDMMRRVPDTRRIRDAIGWRTSTSLSEALEKIIESLR